MQTAKQRMLSIAAGAALCLSGAAATAQQAATPASENTAISQSITVGSGETFMNIGITTHGNMIKFESPAGHEHVNVGTLSEGYFVFDVGTGAAWYDDGYSESGGGGATWGPTTIAPSSPTTVVTTRILRIAGVNVYKLTTVFQAGTGGPNVKVQMTLQNLTKVSRTAFVARACDFDVSENVTGSFANNWGRTRHTIFAWNDEEGSFNSGPAKYGMALSLDGASVSGAPHSLALPHFTATTFVGETLWYPAGGWPYTLTTPATLDPFGDGGHNHLSDYEARLTVLLPTLAPAGTTGSSRTVIFRYNRT